MKHALLPLVLLVLFIFGCGPSMTIYTNDTALKISRLERTGKISQYDDREGYLSYSQELLINILTDAGVGHELHKGIDDWIILRQNEYFITCGAAMNSNKELHLFTIVYKHIGEGVYELVNVQIGEKNLLGKYPSGIIPYTS